jgi:fido (protein-threonine AMPylation protein)
MNSSQAAYKWKPLTDLPDDWEQLRNPELYSLADVWSEQHAQLKQSRSVNNFNERLSREWSIETGILERLYTIDRGVTQLLIEQGIDAALIPHGATDIPVNELVTVIKDHRDALEGLFDFVGSRRELSLNYIRQLHQVITRSQKYVEGIDQFGNPVRMEMKRGQWKEWTNNPTRPDGSIHEYCPPIHVQSEMERLVEFFNNHRNLSPEINAAWLHHRFTQIHPFQDGNGRVARALATIVFLQAGWFPLVINRDQRSDYITALESADNNDLLPLVNLFGQNAKRAFSRALTLSDDILQDEKFLPNVVDGILDLYQSRRQETEKSFLQVENLAVNLADVTNNILTEISVAFQKKFAQVSTPPSLRVAKNSSFNEFYYTMQIIENAKELGYWANVSRRRMWVRLHLFDQFSEQKAQIVFSFHYLGKINRGVMVSTGFIYFPENKPDAQKDDDNFEPQFGEMHRICNEPFYFSYMDIKRNNDLIENYKRWLNDSMTVGLAEWARRL